MTTSQINILYVLKIQVIYPTFTNFCISWPPVKHINLVFTSYCKVYYSRYLRFARIIKSYLTINITYLFFICSLIRNSLEAA